MAAGFKINRTQSKDKLYLKLSGDFDGSSAAELAHTLGQHGRHARRIVIDTVSLKKMHPFGLEYFKRRYRAKNHPGLIWEGKYASLFSEYDGCSV